MSDAARVATDRQYGGFWQRVAAALVDGLILGLVGGAVSAATGLDLLTTDPERLDPVGQVVSFLVGFLYEAGLTASAMQATLGKRAVGLRVVSADGQRLSFLHSTGRFFAKLLSGALFLVGWLMVAFTDRKRGLHDMMAGTLVVKD